MVPKSQQVTGWCVRLRCTYLFVEDACEISELLAANRPLRQYCAARNNRLSWWSLGTGNTKQMRVACVVATTCECDAEGCGGK